MVNLFKKSSREENLNIEYMKEASEVMMNNSDRITSTQDSVIKLFDMMEDMINILDVATEKIIKLEGKQTIELKIKRDDRAKEFPLIQIAKDGDVGYDMYCILDEDIVINPGERKIIPSGLHVELPEGYYTRVMPRSSTSKRGLVVVEGTVDEGYRGGVGIQAFNCSDKPVTIKHGERIAQLIVAENCARRVEVKEVNELSDTERGATGFGSTGK